MKSEYETFYDYMKSYETEELEEIARHGCITGCALGLIYYYETDAFYLQYREEMHEVLLDWVEEIGETPSFILEHLGNAQSFSNAMTWFVAEHYANEILQTRECEAD